LRTDAVDDALRLFDVRTQQVCVLRVAFGDPVEHPGGVGFGALSEPSERAVGLGPAGMQLLAFGAAAQVAVGFAVQQRDAAGRGVAAAHPADRPGAVLLVNPVRQRQCTEEPGLLVQLFALGLSGVGRVGRMACVFVPAAAVERADGFAPHARIGGAEVVGAVEIDAADGRQGNEKKQNEERTEIHCR